MIELIFISSSRAKFANIEYLLRGSNYFITPQRNYGIGYIEPRIYNREELLKKSYLDAKKRFKKNVSNAENKFFILEDTSVVIDALSDDNNEVPGLDIKYWMQEHDFDYLDKELKKRGNNRKCTVRSDILLHLPHELQEKYEKEYLVFTGKQSGYICEQERDFSTNTVYPWLDNKTFNKWFVPEPYKVEDTVISQLSINEAIKYDFRKKAIDQLINFLDKEDLKKYEKLDNRYPAPHLFESTAFILVGSTCAGKSTLASYLSEKYRYYHIEASDFMYLEYHKRHGANPDISIGDFAQDILKKEPLVVAKQVVNYCNKLKTVPIVISGFRTVKEVEYFNEHYYKKDQCVLYISTEQKIRFERCKKRNRRDVAITYEGFCRKDAQQFNMGVAQLEKTVEDKLYNNGTFEQFFDSFESIYKSKIGEDEIVPKKDFKKIRLGELILIALSRYPKSAYSTTEIAHLINREFSLIKPKNKNNISRYFNQSFHPYFDIEQIDGINKYKINTTGLSHAMYLENIYT